MVDSSDFRPGAAEQAFRKGSFEQSLALYRTEFQFGPIELRGLLCAARAAHITGDDNQALAWYDQAMAMAPSHGTAFSRKSSLLLKRGFDSRPQLEARELPQISMRSLGNKGRFGNQIFQYAFLRRCADELGLQAATPEWPGQYVFGIHDPLPGTPLDPLRQSRLDMPTALAARDPLFSGRDITGYFQYHTHTWNLVKANFQQLFTPVIALAEPLNRALDQLFDRGQPLTVFHLRRGDLSDADRDNAVCHWYRRWLETRQSEKPLQLYIASDDPVAVQEFASFDARSLADLQLDQRFQGLEFIVDWMMLRLGDIVGISNSTFSMSAALANPQASVFLRPDYQARHLIKFDPWNAPILFPAPD